MSICHERKESNVLNLDTAVEMTEHSVHTCCVLTNGKHIQSDIPVQTETLCIPPLEQIERDMPAMITC